jgi:hypothetical protein
MLLHRPVETALSQGVSAFTNGLADNQAFIHVARYIGREVVVSDRDIFEKKGPVQ